MILALSTLLERTRRQTQHSVRSRSARFADAFRPYWLLAFVSILGGCDSSEKLPLTGDVSLQFARQSQSGLHLKLLNQSTQSVFFRGTYDKGAGASPWDTLMECKAASSELWDEGPFSLVDGEPHSVEVTPGEPVELIVGSELAQQYKGGHCRVSLRLEGGSFVKSNEFEIAAHQ